MWGMGGQEGKLRIVRHQRSSAQPSVARALEDEILHVSEEKEDVFRIDIDIRTGTITECGVPIISIHDVQIISNVKWKTKTKKQQNKKNKKSRSEDGGSTFRDLGYIF